MTKKKNKVPSTYVEHLRGHRGIGNKNAEKYSEKMAVTMGNDLLKWMAEDVTHLFLDTYFLEIRGLPTDVRPRLMKRFDSFHILIGRAKDIQKKRIIEGALQDKYNAGFAKFMLINNHGMAEKKEVKTTGEIKVDMSEWE